MRRRRRSEAEWRELLAGWRSSGQPLGRYAREHGIPVNSLGYWVKRDGGEDVRLVRVRKDTPPADAEVRVEVAGAMLCTSTAASAQWVAELLRRLGGA